MKLTRQGVRDLNDLGPKRNKPEPLPPECDHLRMGQCHPPTKDKPGCGHFSCPDCNLSWDAPAGM